MKSKILFSILTGLLLSTSAFASMSFVPSSPQVYDPNISLDILMSGAVGDNRTCLYNTNTGDILTEVSPNINLTMNNILPSPPFNITFVDWDLNATSSPSDCLPTLTEARLDVQYVSELNYIFLSPNSQLVASVFSFVDRGVSNNTGTGISTNLVPSVSNLWPIMLIVIGIVLTFYILDKIIEMFKKAQKEKEKLGKKPKEHKMTVIGGDYTNKGDIGYRKEI